MSQETDRETATRSGQRSRSRLGTTARHRRLRAAGAVKEWMRLGAYARCATIGTPPKRRSGERSTIQRRPLQRRGVAFSWHPGDRTRRADESTANITAKVPFSRGSRARGGAPARGRSALERSRRWTHGQHDARATCRRRRHSLHHTRGGGRQIVPGTRPRLLLERPSEHAVLDGSGSGSSNAAKGAGARQRHDDGDRDPGRSGTTCCRHLFSG